MVADQRADREAQAATAAEILELELKKADIPADITGRAKHLYSIYDKMAKRGREFNEIYDLTALRVICERSGEEGTRDCYAALGLVHSLWKPMPGRFKDFVAMPKLNRYRSGRKASRSRSRCGRARCTRRPSTASLRTGCTSAAAPRRPTTSG
jgi:guanosine-3',5'-bis(diphosphate) 3'-pyrophosphohydrolase